MFRWIALTAVALLPLVGCGQPKVDHVVLISVDGLAAMYLNDPLVEMPNLRRLAAEGVSAHGMQVAVPSSTWPSHTTLVTGTHPAKHGIVGNSVLDRSTGKVVTYIGDRELEKSQSVRVPTLYDAAKKAGLKTAAVIWPACNGADTLDFMIPDANRREVHEKYTTPGFTEELRAAGIPIDELQGWGWNKQYSEARDEAYTDITVHLLEKHRPNLLLLHLITPDGIQHAYGPHSDELHAALANVDARIGRIHRALQSPRLRGRSAMFVVADHGFADYDRIIHPNVLLHQMGLVSLDGHDRPLEQQAIARGHGGTAFIHIPDAANRQAIADRIVEAFTDQPGIDKVLRPAEFTRLGVPHPDLNPQAPHLILATGRGYQFSHKIDTDRMIRPASKPGGTHGHLSDEHHWAQAMAVGHGRGLARGVKIQKANSIDIAPTIARLLGIDLPNADGEPIRAWLDTPPVIVGRPGVVR